MEGPDGAIYLIMMDDASGADAGGRYDLDVNVSLEQGIKHLCSVA